MSNAYHLKRLSMLVSKLKGRYVHKDELLKFVREQINASFPESTGYSLRTLQRDFKMLRDTFGINIQHKEGYGYHIAESAPDTDGYMSLLQNFEILSSIYSDSVLQRYVISEHRRIKSVADFTDIFKAIKESRHLAFDYVYFRHGNSISRKEVQPYCLKESQHRWYLVGTDVRDGVIKCFAVDRISSSEVLVKRFRRDDSVDIMALFKECYGIWNDIKDPVEDVILHYDSLDGAFVKTLPLHSSQEILKEDPEAGVTVKVRLRITNDFVMELLSRSRSLKVLAPDHLRERIRNVYADALQRNSINQ